MAKISHFECARCAEQLIANGPATVCLKCSGPLYVRYDMAALRQSANRDSLPLRPVGAPARAALARWGGTMWRYADVLPEAEPVSLGEGFTPMLRSRENPNLLIKDEGRNPTGSFKARGLSLAVTMARAYGLKRLIIASAGNAGGALAAYSAAAGLEAHIFMPKDVPRSNLVECQTYGAQVTLVDGLISDCARMDRTYQQGLSAAKDGLNISTFGEPFRVEGKKTLGYEIAEQMAWGLPDAVIYPTGGGVGLIGTWKAFGEMEQLGWLPAGGRRPKMIAVQAAGCAPLVKSWDEGKTTSEIWQDPKTLAAGLRVPKASADYIILDILRQSGGTAVAVTDDEIVNALRHWARVEGVLAAPEGAASLAAYRKLVSEKFLKPEDRVVLVNTGSGLKYIEVIAGVAKRPAQPPARHIGGIIQPY